MQINYLYNVRLLLRGTYMKEMLSFRIQRASSLFTSSVGTNI